MYALKIETTLAHPVAWQASCPVCSFKLLLMRTKQGLEPKSSCAHFVAASQEKDHEITARFARERGNAF